MWGVDPAEAVPTVKPSSALAEGGAAIASESKIAAGKAVALALRQIRARSLCDPVKAE
jgi:hypothetical protein